jgi:hypothetical protein
MNSNADININLDILKPNVPGISSSAFRVVEKNELVFINSQNVGDLVSFDHLEDPGRCASAANLETVNYILRKMGMDYKRSKNNKQDIFVQFYNQCKNWRPFGIMDTDTVGNLSKFDERNVMINLQGQHDIVNIWPNIDKPVTTTNPAIIEKIKPGSKCYLKLKWIKNETNENYVAPYSLPPLEKNLPYFCCQYVPVFDDQSVMDVVYDLDLYFIGTMICEIPPDRYVTNAKRLRSNDCGLQLFSQFMMLSEADGLSLLKKTNAS